MKAACLLVAFALLMQSVASAQTSTADGIAAIHEGDYARAAQILRPLAQDPSGGDPLAAFFLAMLYHSGTGVARDDFLACGLYLVAAVPANPFAPQARALAFDIHRDGPLARGECNTSLNRWSGQRMPTVPLGSHAPTRYAAIEALTRGDYQIVESELRSLVVWPASAPLPDFVMAALYENGQGVSADPMRACTLYTRATSSETRSPVTEPAFILAREVQRSLSHEQFGRCVALTAVDVNRQLPVTFLLEQGHWISLDIDSATITYQWKETKVEPEIPTPGVVLVAVKHTELTLPGTLPVRRHFIEYFTWMSARAGTWTLHWKVFEVVRDQWVEIVRAELATIAAERPPTGPVDTATMAQLRVNDDGLPMWEIFDGPERGSELIESEAERKEASEAIRAGREPDARVKWDAVRDVRRTPSLAYSGSDGCGDVFVYGWSEDRTEAVTVRVDKEALGLSTSPATFDVASTRAGVTLAVHVYDRPNRSWQYCSDLVMPTGPRQTWNAVSGTITVTLSPPGIRARAPHLYRATIHLVGVEFVSPDGARVRLPQPVTLTAFVGWYSG